MALSWIVKGKVTALCASLATPSPSLPPRAASEGYRTSVYYDYACGLQEYIANRDPLLLRDCVDIVHDKYDGFLRGAAWGWVSQ